MRVSKKSTLSWTGMPFARKSKIFGLHSIPANTTPVFFKTRFLSGFSLTRSFSDAPVAGKTKFGSPPQKIKFQIFLQFGFISLCLLFPLKYCSLFRLTGQNRPCPPARQIYRQSLIHIAVPALCRYFYFALSATQVCAPPPCSI